MSISKLCHLRPITINITTQIAIVIIILIKRRSFLLKLRLGPGIERSHDIVHFCRSGSNSWLLLHHLWILLLLLLHCLWCESIEKVRIIIVHCSLLSWWLLTCASEVEQIAQDLLLLLRWHCLELIWLGPGLREIKAATSKILLLLRSSTSWLLLRDAAPVGARRERILAELLLLSYWASCVKTEVSSASRFLMWMLELLRLMLLWLHCDLTVCKGIGHTLFCYYDLLFKSKFNQFIIDLRKI